MAVELEANPTVALLRSGDVDSSALTHGEAAPSRAVRRASKVVLPQQIRESVVDRAYQSFVFGAPPPADEEFMAALRVCYRPEVERFSEVLGKDMVRRWGLEGQ